MLSGREDVPFAPTTALPQDPGSYIGKPNYSSGPNEGDLVALRELIESGRITPVIDRTYSLSETPEAIRYLEEGHTRGKVVITTSAEEA